MAAGGRACEAGKERPGEEPDGEARVNVEQRAIADLKAHPSNYQRHPEPQMAVLRESLRTHGLQKPLVIQPDGTILAGHGLWEAAKAEGWVQIACHVYDGPYPEAFLVMDNRSAQMAEPDPQALTDLLKSLQDVGQLEMTGYDPDELGKLLAELEAANPTPAPEEGEIPEPQDGPTRVQPGEVWACGKHRVMCGDATDGASVALLLAGGRPNLMVTDPPYGVGFDPKWRDDLGGSPTQRNDYMVPEDDKELAWVDAWSAFPGDVAYVWHSHRQRIPLQKALETAGFEVRQEIIWVKETWPFSRSAWDWQHEACLYCVRKGMQASWQVPADEDARGTTTVWDARPPGAAYGRSAEALAREDTITSHAAQKPLSIMRKPIDHHVGDVYEPFGGSGTTLIAAEQSGRVCFLMELSARYCDVILTRWENLTGEKAERVHA